MIFGPLARGNPTLSLGLAVDLGRGVLRRSGLVARATFLGKRLAALLPGNKAAPAETRLDPNFDLLPPEPGRAIDGHANSLMQYADLGHADDGQGRAIETASPAASAQGALGG